MSDFPKLTTLNTFQKSCQSLIDSIPSHLDTNMGVVAQKESTELVFKQLLAFIEPIYNHIDWQSTNNEVSSQQQLLDARRGIEQIRGQLLRLCKKINDTSNKQIRRKRK